jgi:hypothetical protein
MPALSLPAPWRRFFEDIPAVGTDSAAYARVANAYANREGRVVSGRIIYRWELCEGGQFKAELEDGRFLHASGEQVATLDRKSLKWLDSTLSNQAQAVLREAVTELFQVDMPSLSRRDVVALMALCGEALRVAHVLCLPGRNGRYLTFFLSDLLMASSSDATPSPQRLDVSPELTVEGKTPYIVTPQLAERMAPQHVLARVELLSAEIAAEHDLGNFDKALAKLELAKSMLDVHFVDQEPSGWLMACEGVCQLALGRLDAAEGAFAGSAQCICPPHPLLMYLGMARSTRDAQRRRSCLSAAYFSGPEAFDQAATDEERSDLVAWMDQLERQRPEGSTVRQSLFGALDDLANNSRLATRLSEEASRHREEPHLLCREDEIAKQTYTAAYRDLLLKWFLPPRSTGLSSFGDPKLTENVLSVNEQAVDNGMVDVTVVFQGHFNSKKTLRYRLVKQQPVLSLRELWRLSQIWAIYPDEEIPLD